MKLLRARISTITAAAIIPEATKAIQRFCRTTSTTRTMPYFGSHMTLDDLVMDTAEKVIKANPMYLTKSYVWMAARCVCIDKLQQKKLPWIAADKVNPTLYDNEEGARTPLEELVPGNTHDIMGDLEIEMKDYLGEDQIELYEGLLEGKMYVEIAENLGVSLRTLERQIQELKWMFEYILVGVDPDTNIHSSLF